MAATVRSRCCTVTSVGHLCRQQGGRTRPEAKAGAAGMLARGHAVRLTGARVKRCNGGRCAGLLRLRVREGPAQPV